MLTSDMLQVRPGRPPIRPRRAVGRRRHAGYHALVADADAGTRKLCHQVLQRHGLTVDVVDSGVTALAMARKRRPDLIFIDVQLHDALGLDVIGWLQSNPVLKSVPIIAMSAVSEDLPNLRSSGARALLRKPLSAVMIAEAVQSLIGQGHRPNA
jgi:two-component system cell cycle response regulator DivK